MELKDLIRRYPTLFHMAEADTWDSIRSRGLLSTSAALDLLGIKGRSRTPFESEHRPKMRPVVPGDPNSITLRDQKPMPPGRIAQALPSRITPQDWYRLINQKVFFWVREERLGRLLNSYGEADHDVLEVDTASLLSAHSERAWLCHMNSGNTLPIPHHRDEQVFKRIVNYPAKPNGAPAKEVVELVIDYAIPDIADHVTRVVKMRGLEVLSEIWKR